MYRFEKILVSLSLGENDVSLIRYANLIARLARSSDVRFIYSREPVEIPESLKRQYPWMVKPLEDAAKERAQAFVEEHFEPLPNCKISIDIKDKHPALAALETIVLENIDLVLTGATLEERAISIKLARKAPCSVLTVPANSNGEFSKICAGIDMSRFSEYVSDVATAFASANNITEIDCVSFYKVPRGYQKTNLPRQHFVKDLEEHTSQSLKAFMEKQKLHGVKVNSTITESHFPGGAIHDVAKDNGCDLVVIGCRGKDALTATLLGSNAEDAIQRSDQTAVLAVKEKGTGQTFIESLLGLKSSGSIL
ncbi:MAG: universal stress protein [Verrucomicrobiota bacterium]